MQMLGGDTDPEFSANFDRQAIATNSVSFLGLSPPKACKTVSFFVSFHQGATQSGILFLVSIERGTSRWVYERRPWLSDMSQLGGAPCRFLAPWLWHASVCRTNGTSLSERPIDVRLVNTGLRGSLGLIPRGSIRSPIFPG